MAEIIIETRNIPPDLLEYFEVVNLNRKRSVFNVATQPFPEVHFSTYPKSLVAPMILAGTSPRACERCGAPWERVVERKPPVIGKDIPEATRRNWQGDIKSATSALRVSGGDKWNEYYKQNPPKTTGWRPTCTCENEGKARCIVLDPFAGACTTAVVAANLGRDYIMLEQNPDYVEMGRKRIREEASNLVLPL